MRTQSNLLSPEAAATGPRVAVITGATDGIGRATAVHLARAGWQVVVVGRSAERCTAVVAEIVATGGLAEAVVADLSVMGDVRRAADRIAATHPRLDALVLNANTITQTRVVTGDGFEANLAVGFLGRALLHWRLAALLATTPGAQVLTVIGMDHQRLDLADPHLALGFTARAALMRWQWAVQVLVRETNRRGGPPVNVFMPGLVKTKILANEPQPMRAFVQLANLIIGIPVEKSAAEVAAVLDKVAAGGVRDVYFNRTNARPPRDLKSTGEDGPAVWAWAEAALGPWLGN